MTTTATVDLRLPTVIEQARATLRDCERTLDLIRKDVEALERLVDNIAESLNLCLDCGESLPCHCPVLQ